MPEVTINLNGLLIKEAQGTLQNVDFTRIWTDVVLMPMYRIEFIIRNSKHTEVGYDRNMAFYYGMLNRIGMYLAWERRLVCKQLMNLELSSIFGRVVLEDNITLQYYLRHQEKLEDYRKSSFKAEKALEDNIKANMEARDTPDLDMSQMEDRMLRSIYRAYATAGLSSEDIHNERLPSLPQVATMAKEVDVEQLYNTYRIECHATHGDWFDISRYFLEERDGRFYPRFVEDGTDIRKLNPLLEIGYKTLFEFVGILDGHGLDIEDDLMADLKLIKDFDYMHFNFINKKPIATGLVK